jgi:hypothetical protein
VKLLNGGRNFFQLSLRGIDGFVQLTGAGIVLDIVGLLDLQRRLRPE